MTRSARITTMLGAAVLIAVLALLAITLLTEHRAEAPTAPTPASTASATATAAPTDAPMVEDYYTITGPAEIAEQPAASANMVNLCPLDELGRATCARAVLVTPVKRDSDGELPDPAGWPRNAETEIPALNTVPGSVDYHGWFYNRSHLLADSLGGPETVENLVTGTRMQNVGSRNEHDGGMAYTETIARDYLRSGKGVSCPLTYNVAPQYEGAEMLPRTTTVDIKSCDGEIDAHVVVYNTANQYQIDYQTGAYARVG